MPFLDNRKPSPRRRSVDPREDGAAPGEEPRPYRARRLLVLAMVVVGASGLIGRAAVLDTEQKAFLKRQGDSRHIRVVRTPGHRGMIKDRNGQALAVSTAVHSVWAVPAELAAVRGRWPELAALLDLDLENLHRVLAERIDRQFLYLRRHLAPDVARAVQALAIPGVYLQPEYRRYYPAGEVAAHVVGFTDIDDRGQEGVELTFEDWLRGFDGAKQVIRDRLGRSVEDVANVTRARPGRDLSLSIDLRIQSQAYRTLKRATRHHRASGGSAVVVDIATGEILAMVNQPAYNPNNRAERVGGRTRNRAVTDVFEPGSTVKPFTVAAALSARTLHPGSRVETSPGFLRVGHHTIRDPRDFGPLELVDVLKRSSNVGASRIALATPPQVLWDTFAAAGFGVITGSGFPGESSGILTRDDNWGELERATLAFGYGLSVTTLQLAQAYMVLANDGRRVPVTFLRAGPEGPGAAARAPVLIEPHIARQVRGMLEEVVSREGTGRRAQIPGYRVAGKTGTARKSSEAGYADHRYRAVFAGFAPASAPRLVMVVVIDEPKGEEYYGGQVAAPVFAEVMAGALRLLRIDPDDRDAIAHHLRVGHATSAPHSRPRLSPSARDTRSGIDGDARDEEARR